MPSNFNTFKYAFLGTALLIATVLAAYQIFYAIPQKKCEAAGDWWSFSYHQCAHPIPLVDLTGRRQHKGAPAIPNGATPATASASPAATAAPAASASAAGHP